MYDVFLLYELQKASTIYLFTKLSIMWKKTGLVIYIGFNHPPIYEIWADLAALSLWAHSPYGTHLPSKVTKDVYLKSISNVVEEDVWQCEGNYRRGNWAVVQEDSRKGYWFGWIDLEDITQM